MTADVYNYHHVIDVAANTKILIRGAPSQVTVHDPNKNPVEYSAVQQTVMQLSSDLVIKAWVLYRNNVVTEINYGVTTLGLSCLFSSLSEAESAAARYKEITKEHYNIAMVELVLDNIKVM